MLFSRFIYKIFNNFNGNFSVLTFVQHICNEKENTKIVYKSHTLSGTKSQTMNNPLS